MLGKDIFEVKFKLKPVHIEALCMELKFNFWKHFKIRVLVPIEVMLVLTWSIRPWSSKTAFSIHSVFRAV